MLRAIVDDGVVDFQGHELTARPPLSPVVGGGLPLPIYVAAMGPRALRVAKELADGTLPYLAGPRTIEEFIAPTIAQAASEAGRPSPRIIASVPVAVTNAPATARAQAAKSLRFYDQFPSYQKIMAREGVTHAADLAVIGDPDAVIRELLRYRAAGATDLVLNPFETEPSALHGLCAVAAELDATAPSTPPVPRQADINANSEGPS